MKKHLPLILSALLFSACEEKTSNTDIPEPLKETLLDTQSTKSSNDHYIIEWKTIPANISVNEYFQMEFLVKEPMKPINYPVDLLVDAGMQAHNHGMHTKPITKRVDKQHFISEGMLFHMPGEWQVELEISRGIMKEKAVIEITL